MKMNRWVQLLNETKYVMSDNEPKLKSNLPNLNEISFGKINMYFSYGKLVGFTNNKKAYVVSNLYESVKSIKHINFINKNNVNATKLSYDELINTFNRVI